MFGKRKAPKQEKKEIMTLANYQEGFTKVDLLESLNTWHDSIVDEKDASNVVAIKIISSKEYSTFKKEQLVDVKEYLGNGRYLLDGVGGVITNPNFESFEDVADGNFLYVPIFEK